MDKKIELRANSSPWFGGVEILVKQGDSCGVSVVFEKKQAGVLIEPTFKIANNEAQLFMDDLWNCGIRPTSGEGNTGQLQATNKHLKDMRSIAFELLGVNDV